MKHTNPQRFLKIVGLFWYRTLLLFEQFLLLFVISHPELNIANKHRWSVLKQTDWFTWFLRQEIQNKFWIFRNSEFSQLTVFLFPFFHSPMQPSLFRYHSMKHSEYPRTGTEFWRGVVGRSCLPVCHFSVSLTSLFSLCLDSTEKEFNNNTNNNKYWQQNLTMMFWTFGAIKHKISSWGQHS